MAKEVFLISDTHFGHANVIKYSERPFVSVEEMDEALVDLWNSMVGPKDKVYHLGDVAMGKPHIATMGRLNGDKVLIKGNHDIHPLKFYTPWFRDIRGSHKLDNYIITHIPVHPMSKERFSGNIHGHLHEKVINDMWYQSVSVEQINYTPIAFEELIKRFK